MLIMSFAFIIALVLAVIILALLFFTIVAIIGGATAYMFPVIAGCALVAIPVVICLPLCV